MYNHTCVFAQLKVWCSFCLNSNDNKKNKKNCAIFLFEYNAFHILQWMKVPYRFNDHSTGQRSGKGNAVNVLTVSSLFLFFHIHKVAFSATYRSGSQTVGRAPLASDWMDRGGPHADMTH